MLNSKFGSGNMNFFIADSTTAALLTNIGLLGAILFYYVIYYVRVNLRIYYFFVIVFVTFSFTAILPESYPMSLLFATNIAYFFKYKNDLVLK